VRNTLVLVLFAASLQAAELWTFDRLDSLGGHPATVLGHPKVIRLPSGASAMQFNGVDDAVFVGVHPLAGARTFTWEVIFRPDGDGSPEQRFFHLQERDPLTGQDTQTRLLFEIRIVNGAWCLDSFAYAGGQSHALMDRAKLHPLDAWYHVAMVYDGREFRNYVNGKLEGSVALKLIPQGAGHASAGVRINRKDYFKGAIRLARFSDTALEPAGFMQLPSSQASPRN
jgi:hypothetical protein